MAQIWVAGGGGAAPPCSPLHSGELRGGRPKGSPRPWLQRLVAFSRPSRLSGAAALLGADFFQNSYFSLEKPLVWGSYAVGGSTFSQKSVFFLEQATCLRQLRWLEQNFFSEISLSFEEATCLGQLRFLGQIFLRNLTFLLNTPLVWGSCAAKGRTFSQKSVCVFEDATCLGQLRCLRVAT